jgi:hypothetical protein
MHALETPRNRAARPQLGVGHGQVRPAMKSLRMNDFCRLSADNEVCRPNDGRRRNLTIVGDAAE